MLYFVKLGGIKDVKQKENAKMLSMDFSTNCAPNFIQNNDILITYS